MDILLLGATGRTGKWILHYALEQGHDVTCIARNSNRIKPKKGLKVIEGNPLDKENLMQAMKDCTAVVSALNISRISDFPWAKLRTPVDYLSSVIKKLVTVLPETKIERVIICSAWGVAETKKDLPGWFRWFIDNSNIGPAYLDHERQEEILSGSDTKWTIVRPVGLTNGRLQRKVQESRDNKPRPSLLISRKSVAYFMVKALEREDLVGKRVVVSS